MKSTKRPPMEVRAVRVPAGLWREVRKAAKISRVSVSEFIRDTLGAKVREIERIIKEG